MQFWGGGGDPFGLARMGPLGRCTLCFILVCAQRWQAHALHWAVQLLKANGATMTFGTITPWGAPSLPHEGQPEAFPALNAARVGILRINSFVKFESPTQAELGWGTLKSSAWDGPAPASFLTSSIVSARSRLPLLGKRWQAAIPVKSGSRQTIARTSAGGPPLRSLQGWVPVHTCPGASCLASFARQGKPLPQFRPVTSNLAPTPNSFHHFPGKGNNKIQRRRKNGITL
jgi:hypothetical protein